MKKKHIIFITISILVMVVVIATVFLINRKLELPKLKAEDVARIHYDGNEFNDNKELDIEELL